MSIFRSFSKRSAVAEREIVLDLETTGLWTQDGHRIVEVAAVELRGGRPTGREFHALVNPERPIPDETAKIHGITDARVKNEKPFRQIAQQLRDFIGHDKIVITCRTSNGYTLDQAFLDKEMGDAGLPPFGQDQWTNVRRWSEAMFGDKNATLDKVLDRYGISRKERDDNGHSALLDARLLAQVYRLIARDYTNFIDSLALAHGTPGKKPPRP